jgi:protein O-GlcNAc transferase
MVDTQSERTLELAKRHHQSGRLAEAEPLYQQYLAAHPNHADTLHYLGFLMYSTGRAEGGLDLIRRAIALEPDRAEYHCNLGLVLGHLHYHDEAMQAYRKALSLKENLPQAWFNMAISLHAKKKFDDTVAAYMKALELSPNYAEASLNLGSVFLEMGELDQAEAAFRHSIASKADFPVGYYNLGRALVRLGNLDEAISSFRRALAQRPDYKEACAELGNALHKRGNWQEAIAAYRRVLAIDPRNVEMHLQLAHTLRSRGELEDALETYRKAQVISPGMPEIYHHIGMALEAMDKMDEAAAAYEQAIELRPEYVESLNNLGGIMKDTARAHDALAYYGKAMQLRPGEAITHSNRLYTLHLLPEFDAGAIFHEHVMWNDLHAKPLGLEIEPHDNDRSPGRRLKVGYVSTDFRQHSVAYFLENLLGHHNRNLIESICYSDVAREDAVTQRLKSVADQWKNIVGLSDAKVAEMVRKDKIDILVDLGGHMGGNRLLAFARKPAPVQVTYLGYPDTTGLSVMDYRLTDMYADPQGQTEAFHSERLMRLPTGFLCYHPPTNAPEANELPALSSGKIVFGSFNNAAKISELTIEMWSNILKRLPTSRLILKSRGLSDASPTAYLLEKFSKRGISSDRLELRGHAAKLGSHLAQYHEIDIALDTFPYHGTATTCEALWMGVPVITLAGKTHVQRVGVSLLNVMQLKDLIAINGEDYVNRAVDLAKDLDSLKEIRKELRGWMSSSDLTNGKVFANNMEHAYRKLWLRWCSGVKV